MGNKLSLAKLPFAKPFTSLENVTQRLHLSFTEPDYEPETVANILRVLNDGPDQPDYFTDNLILLEVVGYYHCFIAWNRGTKPLERAINMGSINAITTLGVYYLQHKETFDKGITLLMQAINRGHKFAMHNLVLAYTTKLAYDKFINDRKGIVNQSADAEPDPVINFITEHLDLLDIPPTGKSMTSTAFIAKATYYKVICNDMDKYKQCIAEGVANKSASCMLAFAKDCLTNKDDAQFISIVKELIESGNIQAMYDMGDYYISKKDELKALEYLKMIWDIDPYYNLRNICDCNDCLRMRLKTNGQTVSCHNKLINIAGLMAITPAKLVQLCVNAGYEYLGNHTPGTLALYRRLTEPQLIEEPEIPVPDNAQCPDCQMELDPANIQMSGWQISKCNKYKQCTECFVNASDHMYCCRPCYMKDTDSHRQLIKDVKKFINSPDLVNRLCYWDDIGAWDDGFIIPVGGMEYPLPDKAQIKSLVKYTANTPTFKTRLEYIKACRGMNDPDKVDVVDDIEQTMTKIRAQLAETFSSYTKYSNFYIDNKYIGIIELLGCFGMDEYYHIIDVQGHALFDSLIDFKKHMITDPETNKYINTFITKNAKGQVRINNYPRNIYRDYSIRPFKLDISAI